MTSLWVVVVTTSRKGGFFAKPVIPWCLGIDEEDWICFFFFFLDFGLLFYLASEACGIGGLDQPHLSFFVRHGWSVGGG